LQPRRPLQDRKAHSADDDTSEVSPQPLPTGAITFPPTPVSVVPPSLSSSPSGVASRAAANALNRALSIASKKLFGHSPTYSRRTPSTEYKRSAPSSPRRRLISLDTGVQRDPLEDELLASLEELAQKTEILTHWADDMYEYVKAIPQSEFFLFLDC
jgi:serine/threonine-protein kinase ULK/ATG1